MPSAGFRVFRLLKIGCSNLSMRFSRIDKVLSIANIADDNDPLLDERRLTILELPQASKPMESKGNCDSVHH
jgi:hypothetical protein